MKHCLKSFVPALLLLAAVSPLRAAEWQWSLAVTNSRENSGAARAWLWIPPRCERVRGVVVAWQYGRSSEPKIKTAEPVERTFYLTQ